MSDSAYNASSDIDSQSSRILHIGLLAIQYLYNIINPYRSSNHEPVFVPRERPVYVMLDRGNPLYCHVGLAESPRLAFKSGRRESHYI